MFTYVYTILSCTLLLEGDWPEAAVATLGAFPGEARRNNIIVYYVII